MRMYYKTLLLLLFFFTKVILGANYHISSVVDFVNFSNNSNLDIYNLGDTIYLDDDIDFNETPIGVIGNNSNYFQGTFDGQGHIISNLKIKSDLRYVGLFGYSTGLTIKNIVIDVTCSVESSYSNSNNQAYLGGILCFCNVKNGNCNIENTVNMGSVTFSGSANYLYFGGIAGYIESSSSYYTSAVKNCANYGAVTHTGAGCTYSHLSGIVGFSYGSSSNYNYIQNCLNYGVIAGKTEDSYRLGGIVGEAYLYTKIENCVSGGLITGNSKSVSYAGSIVGSTDSNSYITNCFWTSDVGYSSAYGYGSPTIDDVTSQITDNSETLEKLNTYSSKYTWNGWILNKNKDSVTFNVNNTKGFTLNSQIILLPSLANIGKLLYLWYKDSAYTTPFTETVVGSAKELYGTYGEKNFTISFNTTGGTPVDPITALFNSVVALPTNTEKDGYTFTFWVNEYGDKVSSNSFTVPSRNVTLTAVWVCARITSVDDFIDFSNNVNSRKINYNGITVYLDTDIDLSDKSFDAIGYNTESYFQGTFDGQGHTISNLKINSSSQYVGLFGYSNGITVKNVILDHSCSITCSHNIYYAYVGSIVGQCIANYSNCDIENIVNMASVNFNGTSGSSRHLHLGGFIGWFESHSIYVSVVKNCANYGNAVHSGESVHSYIGGIVGCSSSNYSYLNNCLNYGTTTYNGTLKSVLYIGGIVGRTNRANIENCVGAGEIVLSGNYSTNYIGSIVGYILNTVYINYCFYTNELSGYDTHGFGVPITSNTPNVSSDVNSTLINSLNAYASENSWNGWLLNSNNVSVTLKVNNNKAFSLSSQVILLPDLASDRLSFSGWFVDSGCKTLFELKNDLKGDITLYGLYKLIILVTFDANGGKTEITSKNVTYDGIYGDLPVPNMTGYAFVGWFTEADGGDKIENVTKVTNENNHILYAHWAINNYTITFNFNNGTEPEVSVYNYSDKVIYPEDPKKEEFFFNGWDTIITNMPPYNLIITANWYSQAINIVFDNKGISGDLIEQINRVFDGTNTIIKFEDNEEEGTIICIIKFVDKVEAESFVEKIMDIEDLKSNIKHIDVDGEEWTGKKSDDDDDDDGNDTTIIIVVVVIVVIVVVIAVFVVIFGLFMFRKKKVIKKSGNAKLQRISKKGSFYRVTDQNIEAVDGNKFKSRFKEMKIYPKEYIPPQSIADALMKAGLSEEDANEAEARCMDTADRSVEEGYVIGDFSHVDAAAVCMYTFDFGGDKYKSNPYVLLNEALRAEKNKTEQIIKVRDALYLVMSALRKLPVVNGITLYRGIRRKLDANMYKEGSVIVWPGFSSTSPDINVVKAFLTGFSYDEDRKDKKNGIELEKATNNNSGSGGTLFIIEDGWGYNVQPYSYYPEEEEILLEPEREFKVMSVTDSGYLLIITLKMRKTKPIFDDVFGKRK